MQHEQPGGATPNVGGPPFQAQLAAGAAGAAAQPVLELEDGNLEAEGIKGDDMEDALGVHHVPLPTHRKERMFSVISEERWFSTSCATRRPRPGGPDIRRSGV